MHRDVSLARPRARRLRRPLVTAGAVLLAAVGCYVPPPAPIDQPPRGNFDAVTAVSAAPTGVWAGGWVDDQDSDGPAAVKITVDGQLRVHQPADGDRLDVAAAISGAKLRSGFHVFLPASFGAHQICAWSANTGTQAPDTFLGCRDATIGRGSPGNYAFIVPPVDGTPVRWNGCQVVAYQTRTATAYAGARGDIQAALAAVGAQTGLRFVDAGEVATVPSVAYGRGGTEPLLIGFVTAGESDLFTGAPTGVVGVAGSYYSGTRFVSGRVALEKDRLAPLPRTGPYSTMTVLLHELGHAVGLGHVHDVTQIMNPSVVNYGDWGAGDLTGLRALSTPGCPVTLSAGPQAAAADIQAGPLVFD
jgi:hypothetical protein